MSGSAPTGFAPVEVAGTVLTALPEGPARLAALLDLIDRARSRLQLCYYIFAADTCGYQVRDALTMAARRGVQITLIIDGFGSGATPDSFFAELVAAGAHVGRFRARFGRRFVLRNHQKMAIADGAVALIGGFNVESGYFAPPAPENWRDLGLIVEGRVVAWLSDYHDALAEWVGGRRKGLRRLRRSARGLGQPGGAVAWHAGRQTLRLNDWARAAKHDLARGRHLTMIQAYFAPGGEMLHALKRLAARGTAEIITAQRTDNGATIGAARALYTGLLRVGAAIWEYRPAMLHTKLLIIDDVVYVGSANFDMRSLYLNMEIMLRIDSPAFAAQMRTLAATEKQASEAITPALHDARATPLNRLRWRLAYFLVAVVDYSVSRRLNLGLRG